MPPNLTSSNVNLLMAIITGGGFDSPELSRLHLRGTEQKGVFHSGMQWQKSTNGVFHDVLVSGFPGGSPNPPTEVGGVQISGATFTKLERVEIDGRRYNHNNTPGARVSSSLLMVNAVGFGTPKASTPLLTLTDFNLHDGLYGPVALWHSSNLRFIRPTLGGPINHEESGWIHYDKAVLIDPAVYHYQTANDLGDTTFIDPTWLPSTNRDAGKMFATHLIETRENGTPSAPFVHVDGVPVQQFQHGVDDGFTVVTK
jgi:hypothetical protein